MLYGRPAYPERPSVVPPRGIGRTARMECTPFRDSCPEVSVLPCRAKRIIQDIHLASWAVTSLHRTGCFGAVFLICPSRLAPAAPKAATSGPSRRAKAWKHCRAWRRVCRLSIEEDSAIPIGAGRPGGIRPPVRGPDVVLVKDAERGRLRGAGLQTGRRNVVETAPSWRGWSRAARRGGRRARKPLYGGPGHAKAERYPSSSFLIHHRPC